MVLSRDTVPKSQSIIHTPSSWGEAMALEAELNIALLRPDQWSFKSTMINNDIQLVTLVIHCLRHTSKSRWKVIISSLLGPSLLLSREFSYYDSNGSPSTTFVIARSVSRRLYLPDASRICKLLESRSHGERRAFVVDIMRSSSPRIFEWRSEKDEITTIRSQLRDALHMIDHLEYENRVLTEELRAQPRCLPAYEHVPSLGGE